MELYKRCYRKIPFVASAVCSGCSSSQSAHQTEEQKSNPSFLINLCISWNKMSFQKERKKERNNVLTKGLGCIMISRLTYLSNFDFQTWLNLNQGKVNPVGKSKHTTLHTLPVLQFFHNSLHTDIAFFPPQLPYQTYFSNLQLQAR